MSSSSVGRRGAGRVLGGAAAVATAVVAVVMGVGFLAQRQVATSAFDRLEAHQVAQDAERIRVGLDSWVTLLRNYGATNSIWDSSYADVRSGDPAAFASDFPPADVRGIYGLDGVVAVAPDGVVRAGGIADGETWAALPAGLDAARLRELFDPRAQAGDGRCGVVAASGHAYVFCGFAARTSDGGGADVGGLLYLRALSGAGAKTLGSQLSMPLAVTSGAAGAAAGSSLTSSVGPLRVTTAVRSGGRIDLSVRIPTTGGGAVVLQAARPRPIHGEALRVSSRLMVVTGVLGLLVLGAALWTSGREVRRRVSPVRAATARVVAGDRAIRVPVDGTGALAALCQDINGMLDALAAQESALAVASAEREEQARQAHEQQRASARMLRERAQSAVDETVASVLAELREVTVHAEAVRGTVSAVDERAASAARVTQSAQAVVEAGQRTAHDATANLRQVGGVIETIATVAAQTHLLALNATIEAARAGEAGHGFAVVAHEVKQLAGSTAASTAQITATLTALQEDVSALTETIEGLAGTVGDVRGHAGELGGISAEQRAVMAGLDDRLRQAMQRVGDLATVTETIERRGHERVPGAGDVVLVGAAGSVEGRVGDVSRSGARVTTAVELPVGTAVRVVSSGSDDGSGAGSGPGRGGVAAHVVRVARDERGVQLGLAFDMPAAAEVGELLDRVRAAGV